MVEVGETAMEGKVMLRGDVRVGEGVDDLGLKFVEGGEIGRVVINDKVRHEIP